MLDLTAIKARREKQYNWTGARSEMLRDIDNLIAIAERLQTALTAKDHVLSQFADTANWEYDPPLADESFPLWAWTGDDNPVHLASQALSEGKE